MIKNYINTDVLSDRKKSILSYEKCRGEFNCSECRPIVSAAKKSPQLDFFNLLPGYSSPNYKSGVVFLSSYSPDEKGKLMPEDESKLLLSLFNNFEIHNYAILSNVKCSVNVLQIKATAKVKENCFELTKKLLKEHYKPKVIIVQDAFSLNRLTGLTFYTQGRVINQVLWSNELNCHIIIAVNLSKVCLESKIKNKFETIKMSSLRKTFDISKKILDNTYTSNRVYIDDNDTSYTKITNKTDEKKTQAVFNEILLSTTIAIDIETTGLSIWEDVITYVSISPSVGIGYVFTWEYVLKNKEKFQEIFNAPSIEKVFANGHFDVSFLTQNGFKFSGKISDIQALNYLYRNGIDLDDFVHLKKPPAAQRAKGSNTLKFLAWCYTNMGGYEEAINAEGGIVSAQKTDNKKKKDNFDLYDSLFKQDLSITDKDLLHIDDVIHEELSSVEKYACQDVDATLRIWEALNKVVPENLVKFHDFLLCPLIFEVLVPQYVNGIKMDIDYLKKLQKDYLGVEGSKGKIEILRERVEKQLKLEILKGLLENTFPLKILKELYSSEVDNELFNSSDKEGYINLLRNIQININSSQQFNRLYQGLGYLDKKSNSVEKTVLAYLVDHKGIKSAKYKMTYQTENKLFTTYVNPLLERVRDTGFLHASITATHTESGRLNSRNPNLQNMPASNLIRNAFIPRPGYVFLDLDYSGAELRVVSDVAQEQNFIEEYLKYRDPDLHWKMARLMYNIPFESRLKIDSTNDLVAIGKYLFKSDFCYDDSFVNKHQDISVAEFQKKSIFNKIKEFDSYRQFGKTLNFSILYGTTKYGLAANLHKDFFFVDDFQKEIYLDEAQELINNWFKNVPGITRWLQQNIDDATKKSYIDNVYGRRRWLLFLNSNIPSLVSAAKRETGNTPIQSLASDICSVAAIELKRFYDKNPEDDCRIVNLVHDNIISEVPEEKADFYFSEKVKIMETKSNPLKVVPLVVDGKITKRWEK